MKGTVTGWKGTYGFISPDSLSETLGDNAGRDILFHWSAIESEDDHKEIFKGARVSFELGNHTGRTVAIQVRHL